jgi:hypothetical protein
MADDPNEFDDPEQSYRRGYVHGAREVLAAIERRLPADQRRGSKAIYQNGAWKICGERLGATKRD